MRASVILLLGLVLLGARSADAVGAGPDPVGRGWFVSGTAGRTHADLDLGRVGRSGTGWHHGGAFLRGGVGRALSDQLRVGLEYGVWRRAESAADDALDDRYLGLGALVYSIHPPWPRGFYLRGGAGRGRCRVRLREGEAVVDSGLRQGWALLAGAGWGRDVGPDLRCGVQVDAVFLDTGAALGGLFLQVGFHAELALEDLPF